MKTIFKYKLEITDEQEIAIPDGAAVLSVAAQGDDLCLWAAVDTLNALHLKTIYIHGTGNPIEALEYKRFIGTAVMPNGLVWHVFTDESCCYSTVAESIESLSKNETEPEAAPSRYRG